MPEPMKLQTKPVQVVAMQYTPGYPFTLCEWADGVYMVPRGAEHYLREQKEHDRSNGNVLDGAVPYLVVKGSSTAKPERVDLGDWIIKDADGNFSKCSAEEMSWKYEEVK